MCRRHSRNFKPCCKPRPQNRERLRRRRSHFVSSWLRARYFQSRLKRQGRLRRGQLAAKGVPMSEMFTITLPDGSVREMPQGSTPADVAAAIGPGLAKAALAARVDGELVDLSRPFTGNCALALVTSRDEAEALELARHDYAHVLAEAVQALFPDTQITFGPSTEDGFYYDFAPKDRTSSPRRSCRRILRRKCVKSSQPTKPLLREVWSRDDLITYVAERQARASRRNGPRNCLECEELTVYRSVRSDGGHDWIDMCRGPHLPSTGKLDPACL